jgi:hypothetical protein
MRQQEKNLKQEIVKISLNVFRTATKNKKPLAGGIQSESSRSNCDVANLVTTAKKTQTNKNSERSEKE